MLYAIGWLVVVALLALWSLAAWALHGVAVWTVSSAGAISGAGTLRLPDWLTPWVPAEIVQSLSQMLAGLGPMIDGPLQAAPALSGAVTVTTWVVWGIGSTLLLMLGAGTHLAIALWRRRVSGSGPNAGPSLAAR